MKLLEVCVDSLASARAAKQGGADRLEFCSALAVGGLTPYADLLRQIKAELDLPVRCLMRPRAGDFLYTRDEIELLCRQIETLRDAGADGFVIGALTPEGALDLPAMRALLDACGGAPVTLHRCIDVSRDLCATYRAAAALGIDAVLLTQACSDPLYRRAIRVSMGTVFQVPWTYLPEIWPQTLRALGFTTAAMALCDASLPIYAPQLKRADRLAVVLGTEGDGLSPRTIAACDYTVKIPMAHGVDSLNVAAASAVAFWQLRTK